MKKRRFYMLAMIFAVVFFLTTCKPTPISIPQPTPYHIDIPLYFPTRLNIPVDNPMTEEGVNLGRFLFYDGRLSGRLDADSLISCATCHRQERNFEAGTDHPIFTGGFVHGVTGLQTHHVMMPLCNVVWNGNGYGWNASEKKLENVVKAAIMAPDEIYGDTNKIVSLLQNTKGYPELFAKAFGDSCISFYNIQRAIAQFIRSLTSSNSRFDQYLRGEIQLTQPELNGYVLFVTEEGADCFHCHGGGGNPLFTSFLCYNNGLDSVHNDPHDFYSVSGNPMDRGAYKAPSLRNVVFNGPYMHDGRFSTLDEVIDFYSEQVNNTPQVSPLMHHSMQNGVRLTETEKNDLKAFLTTLTDTVFTTNPQFSKPQKFPDER